MHMKMDAAHKTAFKSSSWEMMSGLTLVTLGRGRIPPPLIDFRFFLLNGYCNLHETLCKFLSYISEDSYTLIWSKKLS